MNNDQLKSPSTPWYKIGMVWVIIALPLSAVVASLVTVNIAHQNAPTLLEKGSQTNK